MSGAGLLAGLACATTLCVCARAQPARPAGPGAQGPRARPPAVWSLARSARFEVYSQAGAAAARSALVWFEQLHGFLARQTGLNVDGLPPIRVIGFRSAKEYEPYRLRPTAGAYCVSTESRDYIVMPALDAAEFGVAAHEYAHAVLHASGYRLPAWLSEGLAEFFSTVRISERGSTVGGDLPARSQELRRNPWISLPKLLESTSDSPLFYAESWTLAEMLVLAPDYAPRFSRLIARLAAGAPGAQALPAVYSRPLDAIARDMQAWAARRRGAPLLLPGVAASGVAVGISEVSPHASRALIAELLAASGDLRRAEERYRALVAEAPGDADAFAALGAIALRRGDLEGARREWRRAIELGVRDATLCYRYAALASMAGIADEEIRPALERALELKPDYDDARYDLALLEKNAGRYQSALAQLRAMRTVAPARAFAYWSAMADALNGLGQREEAKDAARQAMEHAATAEERVEAARLSYIADTDVTVQMTRDPGGKVRMVTTRVPHGTQDWNPFIEPDDVVRRAAGTLREIDCGGAVTRFLLDTAAGPLALAIPDPSKMLVRNAPAEFTCGPQANAPAVMAVFAAGAPAGVKADGVLKGIEFQ